MQASETTVTLNKKGVIAISIVVSLSVALLVSAIIGAVIYFKRKYSGKQGSTSIVVDDLQKHESLDQEK